MLDIIIVKYNNRDYENETISQVLETLEIPYHLTVYENYERDRNLSTVWNDLIRRSDADVICLLNNDTVPAKGWIEKLLEVVKNPKVGAVGPISNRAGAHQGGFKKAIEDKLVECTTLSGFCLVFRKEVWDKVGGFDENFKLYGEDSQFVANIRNHGFKLITHYGVYVYHHGHKSTAIALKRGKDIESIKKESARLFSEYVNKKHNKKVETE